LAEAQQRTERRVEELAEAQQRTERRVEELVEAQKGTEERMGRLETAVTELAEAQQRTEVELRRIDNALGRLNGRELERYYRERAHAYFGPLLKRIRVVSIQEIEDDLEIHLSAAEIEDLSLLDVLVRGSLRQADAPEVWLAIEVSAVIDRHDVERVERRAGLLRKVGYRVVPTMAGQDMTEGAERLAAEHQVFVVQNGRRQHWEAALGKALSV
jgi:chromosome segregation ATPase